MFSDINIYPINQPPKPRGRPFQPGQSGNPGGRPKVIKEIAEKLKAGLPEAIDQLFQIMRTGSEVARLRAIEIILNRGLGKEPVVVEYEDPFANMTKEELIAGAEEALRIMKRNNV